MQWWSLLTDSNYSELLIIAETDSSCLHVRSSFCDNQGDSE
jgi:hypothetical protein